MAEQRIVMDVGSDGVALITILHPPVNSLSKDVLHSLDECFKLALERDDVKAIVITGANGKFSAGFDVTAFGGLDVNDGKVEKFNPVFGSVATLALEEANKPSVAAIDGLALGGGLELAMACHARVSTPTAQLALPELQYGIIPALGGTQRLPRLVGLPKALDMMLMSKPVNGLEAHSLGLVDAIVAQSELISTARTWALDILASKKPLVRSIYKMDKMEPLQRSREILHTARNQARLRASNLNNLQICIDVIEEGINIGPRRGLYKEAEVFEDVISSETYRSLVHVFLSRRGTAEVPGVTNIGLMPRQVKKVAVLGGGHRGSGIATALVLSNYSVIFREVNDEFLQSGIGRVRANLQNCVNKGSITPEEFEKAFALIKGVVDYDSFGDVDMVIEAVIEDVSLKQRIFADLEKYCPPHCVLSSSTSTLDLNLIGKDTKSHNRIVGAHFFSPGHVMPLIEIARTEKTSPQIIVDLLDVAKKIGKTPVVVGNCTGFAFNRMFFPYTQAALFLAERGTDPYLIDIAFTSFGMPMGPFRLIDSIGFGVAVATAAHFHANFPERTYKSLLIPLMQEDKRAGETSCEGFYLYDDEHKARPDFKVRKYIQVERNLAGVRVDPKFISLSGKNIREMILFPVVNEACRVLAEGVAMKAADLDILSVMGMSFPPYRGGIIFWADNIGSQYILSRLSEWANIYGDFFKPCSYLLDRGSRAAPLSDPVVRIVPRF